jgi:hypothetical protein
VATNVTAGNPLQLLLSDQFFPNRTGATLSVEVSHRPRHLLQADLGWIVGHLCLPG